MPVQPTAGHPSTSAFTMKGQPPYIRDLSTAPHPYGLIAYGLLREEGLLRKMCFLDNEYGHESVGEVHVISARVVGNVNGMFAKWNRQLRVFGVAPFRARHHHIEVHWCFVDEACVCLENIAYQKMVLNLYPLSKRAPTDETERSEPMRGSKRTKKAATGEASVYEPDDAEEFALAE